MEYPAKRFDEGFDGHRTGSKGTVGGREGAHARFGAVAWGLIVGVRMVYPVIVPYLQTEYGLSLTVSGLLMTVLWFFYAIG
jgi:hypothetical protein